MVFFTNASRTVRPHIFSMKLMEGASHRHEVNVKWQYIQLERGERINLLDVSRNNYGHEGISMAIDYFLV